MNTFGRWGQFCKHWRVLLVPGVVVPTYGRTELWWRYMVKSQLKGVHIDAGRPYSSHFRSRIWLKTLHHFWRYLVHYGHQILTNYFVGNLNLSPDICRQRGLSRGGPLLFDFAVGNAWGRMDSCLIGPHSSKFYYII